jgi:hypothetical protein
LWNSGANEESRSACDGREYWYTEYAFDSQQKYKYKYDSLNHLFLVVKKKIPIV